MAPITRRKQAEMEANSSAAEQSSPAKAPAPKRGSKLALRGKDGDETKATTGAAKGNITVFDDDEMSKLVTIQKTTVKPTAPQEDEEDEEESDDEAPEAVSTTKAATEVKTAAKATQKAAQEQATAQKRKRQERDALLKKQAEERRKMDDLRSSPAAGDEEKDDESKRLVAARSSAGRKRGGQADVPDLLPAEFLTDSSGESDDEAGAGAVGRQGKPKRRKVDAVERNLTRLDKGPADATVGSTVYRVAKKTDERMAPKVKQYSKSTKELLLKRNRAPAKPRGGFFTKR